MAKRNDTDKIGKKFGRLTVLSFNKRENQKLFLNCICDCGVEKIITSVALVTGNTKSCGCLKKEVASRSMRETQKLYRTPKGIKQPIDNNYKNIQHTWNSKIDLSEFSDYDKLLLITKTLAKVTFKDKSLRNYEYRLSFIQKFYYDEVFNKLYNRWIESDYNKWFRPTIEHLTPLSKGGTSELKNLCFITWFENRAKCDMTLDEWISFKQVTNTESSLFELH